MATEANACSIDSWMGLTETHDNLSEGKLRSSFMMRVCNEWSEQSPSLSPWVSLTAPSTL
ncbi:hypothetical protein CCH79_00001658 [Gambusia affinis]|uniref:Uncharacterized protein n=1 Tax=Gambusia affinis TaxID=33528 RepID=A0A315W1L6_GAMAF|nr:hypothetical protein CCH79_00001658 [Gambusia affinis]